MRRGLVPAIRGVSSPLSGDRLRQRQPRPLIQLRATSRSQTERTSSRASCPPSASNTQSSLGIDGGRNTASLGRPAPRRRGGFDSLRSGRSPFDRGTGSAGGGPSPRRAAGQRDDLPPVRRFAHRPAPPRAPRSVRPLLPHPLDGHPDRSPSSSSPAHAVNPSRATCAS